MASIRIPTAIAVLLVLATQSASAQPLWELGVSSHDWALLEDTSSAALRIAVASEEGPRWSAARLLARKATTEDRAFILTNLWTPINLSGEALVTRALAWGLTEEDLNAVGYDPATFDPQDDNDWSTYYLYNDIKGYFGDSTAVSGMDTLATFGAFDSFRLLAIQRLTEVGLYDHFDVVTDPLTAEADPFLVLRLLVAYGQQPAYKDQSASLLAQRARSEPSNPDYQMVVALALAEVDRDSAATVLQERFEATTGDERNSVFRHLANLVPEREPLLVQWVTPREPDSTSRGRYAPSFFEVQQGYASTQYVSPSFVRFARDWAGWESASHIRLSLQRGFLDEYRPLYEQAGPGVLLDTLTTLIDTLASYEWITPLAFADTLRGLVQSAVGAYSAADPTAAIAALTQFQSEVAAARDNPVPGVRIATEDGHRFLWWTAQYVIDLLE